MKRMNKFLSALLCLILLLSLCPSPALASNSTSVIYISSVEDLIALSGKCSLDSWSQGKTILLTCDLDLSDSSFTPIPTFGGSFDGQEHTISGLSLRGSGDVRGLFRYIQEDGVVQNLRVEGDLLPSDHKDFIGGIAGHNRGTISNCSFSGTISGKNNVGGLVGINEASGQIIRSGFSGSITAEHYVGGIAGQNLGGIVQCRNSGSINTTEVKPSSSLEDISLDNLTSTENAPAVTDVGGIAGFSSGVIQSCLNQGSIGYPHVGYNIGGIAGRQTGYLDSCTNEGIVQGRKDVGGIVGQLEPQLTLKYDETTLNRIWAELDTLEDRINDLLNGTSDSAHSLTDQIGQLSASAGTVKDSVSALAEALTGWADGSIDQINDASARISWVLERMDPILDTVELAIDQLEASAGQFSDGLSQASAAAELGADAAAELSLAMNDIETAIEDGRAAFQNISQAIKDLKQGLGSSTAAEEALGNLTGGLSDTAKAFSDLADSLHRIRLALDKVYEWISDDPSWSLLETGIEDLLLSAEEIAAAIGIIGTAIEKISEDQEAQEGFDLLRTGADTLLTGLEHFGDAYFDLSAALEQLEEHILPNLISHTKNGLESLSYAGISLSSAMNELGSAVQLLSEDEDLKEVVSEFTLASGKLGTAAADFGQAEAYLNAALEALISATEGNPDQFAVALDNLRLALPFLQRIGTNLSASADHLTLGLQALSGSGDTFASAAAHTEQALDDLSDAALYLSSASFFLSTAVGLLESAEMEEISDRLDEGSADLDLAVQDLLTAIDSFQAAMDTLDRSESLDAQLDALKTGAGDLNNGITAVSHALDLINYALEGIEASKIPEETEDTLRQEAEQLDTTLQALSSAFDRITSALSTLEKNLDLTALESSLTELDNAIADLDLAAEGIRQSVGHLESASSLLENAADQLAASLDTFSLAGTSLEQAFSSLEQIVTDVDTLLEEFIQLPSIRFEHLEDHISEEGSALDDAAAEFLSSVNDLNTALRAESEVLTDDLKAVNEQIGAIVDLLHQVQQEQAEIEHEDPLEDVSGQDSGDTRSSGKISSCRNLGRTDGDVNVGGIAGSMAIEYDFDPEDDLTISGSRTLESRYLLRAVVRGCINEGQITAKKNQAGGIVGSMDFGRVIACQGYGSVTSTNGRNVGGIAGASYGGIQSSWAMCRLSGKECVGGIAGIGTLISDCRSLIDMECTGTGLGAIAGQVEAGGELSGNLFVHHLLGGVDGVSYKGQAEPISYEAFCALDGLPANFTQFTLTFMANGVLVLEVPFTYGDSLELLPNIPELSGYSARWPDADLGFLTFSRILDAEYLAYDTALSDESPVPQYLVSGSFSPDARISVTEAAIDRDTPGGSTLSGTSYTVKVEDPSVLGVDYTLHWRLSEDTNYNLWVWENDSWNQRKFSVDGSYLLLDLPADSITFCLVPQTGPSTAILLLCLGAGAVLIALLILIFCTVHKKHRRKPAAVSADGE